MLTSETSRTRYRADVDGLRAVAVALVILYHLRPHLAPGGFAGVDIFFVISGFVVTRSVLGGPAASGNPMEALGRFWRRRVLRIIPARLCMVIASSLAIAIFSPPFPTITFNANFRTGMSAIFGLGNLYLYRSRFDYFQADSATNPFVHTWSLGVEEQFYLAYALVFLGGAVWLRGARAQVLMAALGTASGATFLWYSAVNPAITYYLIPFRFWEIAAGSLLAYLEVNHAEAMRIRRAAVAAAMQLSAVAAIVAAVWWGDAGGFSAVRIAVGAAAAVLLIASGGDATLAPVSRVLAVRPLVATGLVSYSLYLWHYPILLLWRTNIGLESWTSCLLTLAVVVGVALASYRLVELRVRHSKASFGGVLAPALATLAVAALALAWLPQARPGMLYAGTKHAWNDDWLPVRDYAYAGAGRIQAANCNLGMDSDVPAMPPPSCMSATSGPPMLLVGDSHAFADWGMAAHGAVSGVYQLSTLSHDECALATPVERRTESCRLYWSRMPELIRTALAPGGNAMVAVFWGLRDQTETLRAISELRQMAKAAREKNGELIVQAPLPVFGRPAYLCTEEWFRFNYDGCTVDRLDLEQRRAPLLQALEELSTEVGNVRVWDPLPLLCPGETCRQFRSGRPLFRDTNHLAVRTAQELGPAFVDFLRGDSAPAPLAAQVATTALGPE